MTNPARKAKRLRDKVTNHEARRAHQQFIANQRELHLWRQIQEGMQRFSRSFQYLFPAEFELQKPKPANQEELHSILNRINKDYRP